MHHSLTLTTQEGTMSLGEDVLVPLGFFAMVFGFPLLRREMKHRHLMEKLRLEQSQAPLSPFPLAPAGPDDAPALALRLPEPHRLYALAPLCRLQDASPAALDARTQFVLAQTRAEYLPETLRGYLNLTPTAREALRSRGQNPETLLREQLELISKGVDDALAQDDGAARQVLTQGAFLRDVFGEAEAEKVRV